MQLARDTVSGIVLRIAYSCVVRYIFLAKTRSATPGTVLPVCPSRTDTGWQATHE